MNPLKLVETYGVDQLRFFLLKKYKLMLMDITPMTYLSIASNNVLGNDLGNLIQRVNKLIEKDFQGIIPKYDVLQPEDLEILNAFNQDFNRENERTNG